MSTGAALTAFCNATRRQQRATLGFIGARNRLLAFSRRQGDDYQRRTHLVAALKALCAASCGGSFEGQPFYISTDAFRLRLAVVLGRPVARSTAYLYLSRLRGAGVCMHRHGRVVFLPAGAPETLLKPYDRSEESPRRWTADRSRIAKSSQYSQEIGSVDIFTMSVPSQGEGMGRDRPRVGRGAHNKAAVPRAGGRFIKAPPPAPPDTPPAVGERPPVAAVAEYGADNAGPKSPVTPRSMPSAPAAAIPPADFCPALPPQAEPQDALEALVPDPVPPKGYTWPQVAQAVQAGQMPFDGARWLSPAQIQAQAEVAAHGRLGGFLGDSSQRIVQAIALKRMSEGRPPWSERSDWLQEQAEKKAGDALLAERRAKRQAAEAERARQLYQPRDTAQSDDEQLADGKWLAAELKTSKAIAGLEFFRCLAPGVTRRIMRMAVARLLAQDPGRTRSPHAYVAKVAREMAAEGAPDPRVRAQWGIHPGWDDVTVAFAGVARHDAQGGKWFDLRAHMRAREERA